MMRKGGSPSAWDGLASLPPKAQRAVDACADVSVVWPGQVVLGAGTAVRWLWIVTDGELALRRGGRDVRILRGGDLFGVAEMLGGPTAGASLVSRDVSRFITIPKRNFTALVESEPGFAAWVLRAEASAGSVDARGWTAS